MQIELQTFNFRPLVDSHEELAPYLAGLNVSEALRDFDRLADLVLSNEQAPQQPMLAASSCGYSHDLAGPSSPGGASLYSTATTKSSAGLSWSQVSSPLSSDHSSFASSSSCSSFPSSAASSVCGDFEDSNSCAGKTSAQRRQSRRGERRRQNATAAERYRRKLKGRRCGLDEELERERARNAQLLRSFEAKLELYREFADLLAANTRDPSQDLELARLGSRSLANILERICPAQVLASNGRQRVELERLQEHFRRVLSIGQFRPSR